MSSVHSPDLVRRSMTRLNSGSSAGCTLTPAIACISARAFSAQRTASDQRSASDRTSAPRQQPQQGVGCRGGEEGGKACCTAHAPGAYHSTQRTCKRACQHDTALICSTTFALALVDLVQGFKQRGGRGKVARLAMACGQSCQYRCCTCGGTHVKCRWVARWSVK
jgi:hypothetical protein